MSRLVVVTGSTDVERAWPCITSWGDVETIIVVNGDKAIDTPLRSSLITCLVQPQYLGTVAAFKAGVDYALEHTDAEVIANLHDDVILQDPDWVAKVLRRFDSQPAIGLLGFGGAIGLGDADIYQKPYQPVQLARIGFRSNLQDAEVHGVRSLLAERVAALDGFSLIGRRTFFAGGYYNSPIRESFANRPWTMLDNMGVRHHAYDGIISCLASRYGWETWFLPIRCRHLGGQTAVGDQGYQKWAQEQPEGSDQGFWEAAHQAFYENCRDQLPLRV